LGQNTKKLKLVRFFAIINTAPRRELLNTEESLYALAEIAKNQLAIGLLGK
jgi:hypothetical protein